MLLVIKLYEALLHLYPAEFREEYGRELKLVFKDRLRERASAIGVLWTLLHATAGILIEAPREHLRVLRHDVRYALRILRKEPLFTGAAAGILALGIGSTTLVFTVANTLLVRPLPYPGQERPVVVQEYSPKAPQFVAVAFPNFHDLRSRTRLLDSQPMARTRARFATTPRNPNRWPLAS